MKTILNYKIPILLWVLFEAIAFGLWLGLDNLFYLFNFSYIGTCLALGIALYEAHWKYAREFTLLAIGSYLLIYIGFIKHENMQIEGFWCYLALGIFSGATIHYLIAKIFGPAIFGRGFCGYACWTAMILDLLPYKTRQKERRSWTWVRFVVLGVSILVSVLLLVFALDLEEALFIAFILGNLLYYAVGIVLAFVCKDNRAFCKYICPISLVMKPAASVSLMRITCDAELCIDCGKCKKACPMDVDMTDNSRRRTNETECILCLNCVDTCPVKALKL